jgi:hypothetical protein
MPQALLPLVPHGATPINDLLSVVRDGGQWTYFLGVRPVFAHDEDDQRSFRMFTAQLVCQGACQQTDIVAVFGVAAISVKRGVKKFREEGIPAFYGPRRGRGAAVLTPEVIRQAQEGLHRGQSRRQVADQLGLKPDTLRKAIQQGRLFEPCHSRPAEVAPAKPVEVLPEPAASPADCNTPAPGGERRPAASVVGAAVLEIADPATDKSQRTVQDAAAADGLGMACTRVCDRVAASLGLLPGGAATQFEPCRDVKFGGVLCALPALAQCGLFRHLEACFTSLGGYYTTLQVMTLLGYMALCRIKTVEQLQYESPGELGKLLGLDRVPEVRCLRGKLTALSAGDAPQQWAALLSRDWMEADPELAGTLYVDGHVRLYHGEQTQLPRRYVARQKLCLRGTTDYWTNDALGQPFFVVQRPIDQGLLEVLRHDVVPRLLRDVPGQPTQQELDAAPLRHRFLLIFDREGYSPEFMRQMWQEHRIACITYHKYPKEQWPESEFAETRVTLPSGEAVSLKLAERGSWIGSKRDGLWVREVRKLTATSHQTSLISTAYSRTADRDAGALFSRWSQENFFRYAMQHYGIDLLAEYGTEKIPGTNRPLVNPARRTLDSRRRSLQSQLTQRRARYAALSLHPESDPEKLPEWERDKGELVELIEQLEHTVEEVKQQQKETPKHLEWKDLPEAAKCEQLAPGRKRLLDTVKMIAYRAETAMVNIVRETLKRADDARSLVRDLFRREADLTPDPQSQELRVTVHSSSNPRSDRALDHLLKQLTAAEQPYPGTTFKLTYSLAGAQIPETVSE